MFYTRAKIFFSWHVPNKEKKQKNLAPLKTVCGERDWISTAKIHVVCKEETFVLWDSQSAKILPDGMQMDISLKSYMLLVRGSVNDGERKRTLLKFEIRIQNLPHGWKS